MISDWLASLRNMRAELGGGGVFSLATRLGDILLVILVVSIVGMMLVPLPTWLLDLLLTCNITLAVTILMVSMYIADATQLASFPTILLITTLYRLALNVSSTRLILLQADAGEVIRAFGMFVAGGNIVVGVVIFLILTLIQFIVITKGSERVAEVSARFTLDAMPGKQMSIDADLRSGIIDVEEAKRRRAGLQRESQLYGAMDGAMKFVKGDAIAGIVITLINIVGGLLIGVLMRGMAVLEAVQVYSILTIGDGLVSQIPSLLISVSAGMVTTRVASEDQDSSLGKDVTRQILAQPRALAFVGGLLLALGLIPGLPTFPFLLLSALVGTLSFALIKARHQQERETALQVREAELMAAPELSVAVPVLLEVSADLTPFVDRDRPEGRRFFELLSEARSNLYYETGVVYPPVRVQGDSPLPSATYRCWLNEAPVRAGILQPDQCLVNETAQNLALYGISAEAVLNPLSGRENAWIAERDAQKALNCGLQVWRPHEVLVLVLTRFLKEHSREFLGIQEVQWMLDQVSQYYPKLVDETVPKVLSLQQLVEILQRLVEEGVPIRDVRSILQCLSEWARLDQDPVRLTDQVRLALRRRIGFQITQGNPVLYVYQLDPEVEEMVREALRQTSTGTYLMLEPEQIDQILQAVTLQIGNLPSTAQRPVILTEADVRRFIRKLLEASFPDLVVLSYQELLPEITVQPLAVISLPGSDLTQATLPEASPEEEGEAGETRPHSTSERNPHHDSKA